MEAYPGGALRKRRCGDLFQVVGQWIQSQVTSVVVVGSGFTGFECARRLARRLRRTDVEITIISPVDYMLYTPLLPDVAGGVVDARFVAIPLAGTLKGVRAIRGRVDRVDLDGHRLHFTDMEHAPANYIGTDWFSRPDR